jgi:hypothetical protein
VSGDNVEDWGRFQATRALTVLSLLAGAAALVCGFVARAVGRGRFVSLALHLSVVALVLALIAMAVFASVERSFTILQTSGRYSFGAGFGLCIVTWLLQLAAVGCFVYAQRYSEDEPVNHAPLAPKKSRANERLSAL